MCSLHSHGAGNPLRYVQKLSPAHGRIRGPAGILPFLSCPEAARIILTGEKPQSFLTEEDDTEDEIFFDDMDLLLFSQLEDARAAMFEILQDQTLKMQNKKDLIVHMAADIQRQIDENEYFKN